MKHRLRIIALLLALCVPVVSFAQELLVPEQIAAFFANCTICELMSIRELLDEEIGRRENTGENLLVYVLNINTDKFHSPECKSTRQIREKNRVEYSGSREVLVKLGFTPCNNCKP